MVTIIGSEFNDNDKLTIIGSEFFPKLLGGFLCVNLAGLVRNFQNGLTLQTSKEDWKVFDR